MAVKFWSDQTRRKGATENVNRKMRKQEQEPKKETIIDITRMAFLEA